jgi:DNA-binding protein H-NS
MARSNIHKMSFAELTAMEQRIARAKAERQDEERATLRKKVTDFVKSHGFDVKDLFGGRAKLRGPAAPKFQDPANPENTWTGRGRMPRCMAQATTGGKANKVDFLIK